MLGPLRNPVSLAHTATTVDLISEGRLILGMGVGGVFNEAQKQEWVNVGVDPRNRAGKFEELLKIFKPLTRGEVVTFKGRFFSVQNVSIKPVSTQQNGIPVLVAAHGRSGIERQYERVLLGDGAISISDYVEEYTHSLERIEFHAEKKKIDFGNLEKTFYMTVNISEDEHGAAEESDRFLKLYYGINIWGDRWGPWGPSEEVVQKIKEYSDAGANTVIVRFASFEQSRQMDLFLNEVLPYI
jgi:alkanesulfonate monooxygenase SsuD/methylene tetrahydromethanopterin reductase-like flavin-dependent oxidoreductase (luciferase family)